MKGMKASKSASPKPVKASKSKSPGISEQKLALRKAAQKAAARSATVRRKEAKAKMKKKCKSVMKKTADKKTQVNMKIHVMKRLPSLGGSNPYKDLLAASFAKMGHADWV